MRLPCQRWGGLNLHPEVVLLRAPPRWLLGRPDDGCSAVAGVAQREAPAVEVPELPRSFLKVLQG